MERSFESSGLRGPLWQATLVHALVVFLGVLPAFSRRPPSVEKATAPFADLEVHSLDPLEAARLLSMGSNQAVPSLADLPREASRRPQSGPLELQLPELPARPGAVPLPQPRQGPPSRRLLESGREAPRERSAIETLERRGLMDASRLRRPLELPRGNLERPTPSLSGPRVIELEGQVLGALTLYREEPQLAPELVQSGAAGVVWVEMRLDAEGLVQDALVVTGSGNRGLDEAALAAARRWRFDPVGLEAAGTRRCRYRFRIDGSAGPGGN
jgi:TonB family protein